jgi:hypothetical protein
VRRLSLLLFPALLLLVQPARTAPPEPAAGLVVGAYSQRRADRWTGKDGLPAGKIHRIEVLGNIVRAYGETGMGSLLEGWWQLSKVEEEDRYGFVNRGRLPKGAKVLSAAQGPDRRVWVVTDQGVFRSEGDRYRPVTFPNSYLTHQRTVNIDAEISCVAVDAAGLVWFGSNAGLFSTDGANYWNVIDRTDGLPFEYVTCLALPPTGEIWVGTREGVCRYTRGGWQYYWGPRYLPNNRINDIAVDVTGAAWIATDGGVARLYDDSIILVKKAEHYQQITAARHNRRGYVTGSRLKKPGDVTGGHVHEASDNDGLWTAVYVGAQAFRYAATKDPDARAEAKRSMWAMLDLVRLSGYPGFPARAVITKGEEVDGYNPEETVRVPGETDKIWYQSRVDPNVLCKGDTSSDELDGHYFAWLAYYDLVADDAEKREIRDVVRAVTDNLLTHDLTLVGHTGRKTRWGVYSPKHINDDPAWWEERGLNALSMLSYLKVADHICGDARFRQKYRELIDKHHYLLNTVMQKIAFEWDNTNHSDDQMAFMQYWCILRLEKDPAVRRVLLQSIERSWRIDRPEASPFFNFVYGTATGAPCDVEAAAETLREWPWELVEWQMRGSHRHDVQVRTRDAESSVKRELTRVLPISERRLMRWNGNPFEADGGHPAGTHEEDGSAWLLPYWMGRYYGFLREAGG